MESEKKRLRHVKTPKYPRSINGSVDISSGFRKKLKNRSFEGSAYFRAALSCFENEISNN